MRAIPLLKMAGRYINILSLPGILLLLSLPTKPAIAQQFSGMKGSIYSPVINTSTQPSSGSYMPYRWGLELAGFHTFWNNNILSLSPAKMDWDQEHTDWNSYFITGRGKHWGTAAADIHLLHFLFHWPGNKKWIFGAGWSARSRIYTGRLNYDYEDSLTTFSRFLRANAMNKVQKGSIVNQQWMEWYANASVVVRENRYEKLAAGLNLKLLKGIGAEVVDIQRIELNSLKTGASDYTALTSLKGRYGYSENLEDLEDNEITPLTKGSPVSLGLDIGLTYMRKRPVYIAGFTSDDPADYNWKLAIALTDFGRLKYPLGRESRLINGLKGSPDLAYLQQSLQTASSLTAFNDSLNRIADLHPWEGATSISLPTALRINFDKNLEKHFFVNASLVLDASFINPGTDYKMHSPSYLIITPRWEIKRIGIYVPLYLNIQGAFMAGAALRLGPLVAGVHDFGWLFKHTKSGGAYMAIVIKSLFKKKEACPTF